MCDSILSVLFIYKRRKSGGVGKGKKNSPESEVVTEFLIIESGDFLHDTVKA
jgi:hypothetical protein